MIEKVSLQPNNYIQSNQYSYKPANAFEISGHKNYTEFNIGPKTATS